MKSHRRYSQPQSQSYSQNSFKNPKSDTLDFPFNSPFKIYKFDNIFWPFDSETSNSSFKYSQVDVYNSVAKPLLDHAFLGYNICILAYGQSGSGKTFTMFGDLTSPNSLSQEDDFEASSITNGTSSADVQYSSDDFDDWGIVPRVCHDLFSYLNRNSPDSNFDNSLYSEGPNFLKNLPKDSNSGKKNYTVEVSYYEIYSEKVYDLLSPTDQRRSLKVREHPTFGPYIEDITKAAVSSIGEIMDVLITGNDKRITAFTNINSVSSRSHAVFSIKLVQNIYNSDKNSIVETVSNISLVDLAGSEKLHMTGATDLRMREGISINKSLTTLSKVTSALAANSLTSTNTSSPTRSLNPTSDSPQFRGKSPINRLKSSTHIPYRDSVLTWLLKESLGGNSKTSLIATVNPLDYNETLSTLNYAERVKHIVNIAVVNEESTDSLVNSLKLEIKMLKDQLRNLSQGIKITQSFSILDKNMGPCNDSFSESKNVFNNTTHTYTPNLPDSLSRPETPIALEISNSFANFTSIPNLQIDSQLKISNSPNINFSSDSNSSNQSLSKNPSSEPDQILKIKNQITESEKFLKEFSIPWEQKLRKTKTLIDSRTINNSRRLTHSEIYRNSNNDLNEVSFNKKFQESRCSQFSSFGDKESTLEMSESLSNNCIDFLKEDSFGNSVGILVQPLNTSIVDSDSLVYYIYPGLSTIFYSKKSSSEMEIKIFNEKDLNGNIPDQKTYSQSLTKIFNDGRSKIALLPPGKPLIDSLMIKVDNALVTKMISLNVGSRISIGDSIILKFASNFDPEILSLQKFTSSQLGNLSDSQINKNPQIPGIGLKCETDNMKPSSFNDSYHLSNSDFNHNNLFLKNVDCSNHRAYVDVDHNYYHSKDNPNYSFLSDHRKMVFSPNLADSSYFLYKNQSKFNPLLPNIMPNHISSSQIEGIDQTPILPVKKQSRLKYLVSRVIQNNRNVLARKNFLLLARDILVLSKSIKTANVLAAKFSLPAEYSLFIFKSDFKQFPISYKSTGLFVNGIDPEEVFNQDVYPKELNANRSISSKYNYDIGVKVYDRSKGFSYYCWTLDEFFKRLNGMKSIESLFQHRKYLEHLDYSKSFFTVPKIVYSLLGTANIPVYFGLFRKYFLEDDSSHRFSKNEIFSPKRTFLYPFSTKVVDWVNLIQHDIVLNGFIKLTRINNYSTSTAMICDSFSIKIELFIENMKFSEDINASELHFQTRFPNKKFKDFKCRCNSKLECESCISSNYNDISSNDNRVDDITSYNGQKNSDDKTFSHSLYSSNRIKPNKRYQSNVFNQPYLLNNEKYNYPESSLLENISPGPSFSQSRFSISGSIVSKADLFENQKKKKSNSLFLNKSRVNSRPIKDSNKPLPNLDVPRDENPDSQYCININKKFNFVSIPDTSILDELGSIYFDLFGKVTKFSTDVDLKKPNNSFSNLEPNQSMKTGERLHEDQWLTPKSHELVVYTNFLEINDSGSWGKVPVLPATNWNQGKHHSESDVSSLELNTRLHAKLHNIKKSEVSNLPKKKTSISMKTSFKSSNSGRFSRIVDADILASCCASKNRISNLDLGEEFESPSYDGGVPNSPTDSDNNQTYTKYKDIVGGFVENDVILDFNHSKMSKFFVLRQGMQRMIQISITHNSGRKLDLNIKNVYIKKDKSESSLYDLNGPKMDQSNAPNAVKTDMAKRISKSNDLKAIKNNKFVNSIDNRTFINFFGVWDSFKHFENGQESISTDCKVFETLITIEVNITNSSKSFFLDVPLFFRVIGRSHPLFFPSSPSFKISKLYPVLNKNPVDPISSIRNIALHPESSSPRFPNESIPEPLELNDYFSIYYNSYKLIMWPSQDTMNLEYDLWKFDYNNIYIRGQELLKRTSFGNPKIILEYIKLSSVAKWEREKAKEVLNINLNFQEPENSPNICSQGLHEVYIAKYLESVKFDNRFVFEYSGYLKIPETPMNEWKPKFVVVQK
ncbi:Kinesin-like protein KIF1B [Smittium mucronatum]|uniref:Kinesin-like protein KIF1B n=1 Tax=Smittium mucronatum TaxID=133383 RepID=A0A1R0H935_9FUNG|nr:Kinesin-like protein KIF1B [Smittium mucronatum]